MGRTHPSVAGVARGRYWARAVIRASAVVITGVALVRALGWVVGCMFSDNVLSFLTLYDFWVALAPLPVAAGLAVGSDRLARWMMPVPEPVCPECGYAVEPATDRCPECGLRRDMLPGG